MRRAIIRPRGTASRQGPAAVPVAQPVAHPVPPTRGAAALSLAGAQSAPTAPAPAPHSPLAQPPEALPPGPPARPPRFSGRSGYSLFVFLLKVLLPATATALILLVIAWPQLLPGDTLMKVPALEFSLDQADRLSMLNPRFDGIDGKNRPYSITADEAIQDRDNDDIVDLRVPKADMSMEDGTWLAVMARNGRYHREAETVDLQGDVVLFHDQGFEMKTEFAHIDLKSGVAEGDQPVEGQGPGGSLTAEGFTILEKGERIIFTGKSHMVMYQ
jgi:lipopolysaccharide export system protein LptC